MKCREHTACASPASLPPLTLCFTLHKAWDRCLNNLCHLFHHHHWSRDYVQRERLSVSARWTDETNWVAPFDLPVSPYEGQIGLITNSDDTNYLLRIIELNSNANSKLTLRLKQSTWKELKDLEDFCLHTEDKFVWSSYLFWIPLCANCTKLPCTALKIIIFPQMKISIFYLLYKLHYLKY